MVIVCSIQGIQIYKVFFPFTNTQALNFRFILLTLQRILTLCGFWDVNSFAQNSACCKDSTNAKIHRLHKLKIVFPCIFFQPLGQTGSQGSFNPFSVLKTMRNALVITMEKSLGTNFNLENWMLVVRLLSVENVESTLPCNGQIQPADATKTLLQISFTFTTLLFASRERSR